MLDDDALQREVVALTQDLIRVDTTNHPGHETPAAQLLADYLVQAGVECELVAREPDRANLVARIRGGDGPSLAFVGHLDVVPAEPQDWTHAPFEGVVDDEGYLYGRGAVDMKNEVAARAVAMAELARSGFSPSGDLWLLAVADEEDGTADVGMRWLLEQRPDIRPDHAVNEGGGERFELTDGRTMVTVSVGEKGTYPARVTALGEAGHASTPTIGRNAVPLLAELVRRVGRGVPTVRHREMLASILAVLVPGETAATDDTVVTHRLEQARSLHPMLEHLLPALAGTTMAPTMLAASPKRNVMPARASVELDCRILPGTSAAEVEAEVRAVLGSDIGYELTWPEELIPGTGSSLAGPLAEAITEFVAAELPSTEVLPVLCTGFTDSFYLRQVGTTSYGFSPFLTTPAEVLEAGYHNADERVHVDDLLLATRFHVFLAQRLLGPQDA